MHLLLPATIAGLLVSGMGVALLGSIKLPLARKLSIDEARVGGFVSVFGFTTIPVILGVGVLTDRIGPQAVLVAGTVLMAGSLAVLAQSKTCRTALVGVLILGAGWSAVVNVLNVLTPPAFLKPEDIPQKTAFATNLANVFFGAGAFLTPWGVGRVLRRGGLSTALWVLAGLVVVTAVLAGSADFSAFTTAEAVAGAPARLAGAEAQAGMEALVMHPVLWLCALAMFFYGPLEASLGAWTTTFLTEHSVSEEGASGVLSGFWLSFMAARLITAVSLPSGYEARWILLLSVGAVAVLAGMVGSRSSRTAVALVIAAGFLFGPIFPTVMAILLSTFDKSLHGRAVGLFFAVGGIGWTTIPLLIGASARRTSLQRGFLIAVGCAVGLVLVAVALTLQV